MLPAGERTRRAVRWISDALQESESANLKALIQQAIFRFDLNPKESEELMQFYQRAQENQSKSIL